MVKLDSGLSIIAVHPGRKELPMAMIRRNNKFHNIRYEQRLLPMTDLVDIHLMCKLSTMKKQQATNEKEKRVR